MAMSTLSVVTTVFVLRLHHAGWTRPVPDWVQTLAFRVFARALCMRRPSVDTDAKPVVPPMTSQTELENDVVATMCSCGRSLNYLHSGCTPQLCARFDLILAQLRKVDDVFVELYSISSSVAGLLYVQLLLVRCC